LASSDAYRLFLCCPGGSFHATPFHPFASCALRARERFPPYPYPWITHLSRMRVGHAQVTCARLISSSGLRVAPLHATPKCSNHPRLCHTPIFLPFLCTTIVLLSHLSCRIGSEVCSLSLSHLVSSTVTTTRPLTYPQGCLPFFILISRRSYACSSGNHCGAIDTTSRMESNHFIHLMVLLMPAMAKVRPLHITNVTPLMPQQVPAHLC
jgi:hypothetical protein